MENKSCVVTFWFNIFEDVKKLSYFLNEENLDDFTPFNLTGVPSTIDPVVPRIVSNSLGGHTTVNISKINLQLITNFDGDYERDINLCIDYVREKAVKFFNLLIEKCDIKVLYSAVAVNYELFNDNSEKYICNKFINHYLDDTDSWMDVGVRYSSTVEDKFYNAVVYNSSKMIKYTQTFDCSDGDKIIVLPLIPLKDVVVEKNFVSINDEFNDKLSFNSIDNYSTNIDVLNELFNKTLDKYSRIGE